MQTTICLGFWFFGCVVVLYWVGVSQAKGLNLLAALTAVILAGWVTFSGLKSSPTGSLVWDGQSWHWESTGYEAGLTEYEVLVAADFQHMVLLRLENPAKARMWLWVERSASPERWLDLRRAVYSPHRQLAFQATPA